MSGAALRSPAARSATCRCRITREYCGAAVAFTSKGAVRDRSYILWKTASNSSALARSSGLARPTGTRKNTSQKTMPRRAISAASASKSPALWRPITVFTCVDSPMVRQVSRMRTPQSKEPSTRRKSSCIAGHDPSRLTARREIPAACRRRIASGVARSVVAGVAAMRSPSADPYSMRSKTSSR